MKLLFLDTETTGVDYTQNGIIEIAGIIEKDGREIERFNCKCKPFPGQLCKPDALKLLNISIDEIREYAEPQTVYREIIKIFDRHIDRYDKTDKFHMVGQNTKFDYDFMNAWFKNNGNQYFYAYVNYHLIDIIQATALFKLASKIDVPNMKLETVANFFDIKFNAHNAMSDIETTRLIFHKYLEGIKSCNPFIKK